MMDESNKISVNGTSELLPLNLRKSVIFTIVPIGIILWICAVLLWTQGELDPWFLISLNSLRSNGVLIAIAQAVSKYGMAFITLVYLVYLILAYKIEKLRDAYTITLSVIFMFGLMAILGDILKVIFGRPRPIVELAGQITAFSSAETLAFPSGHATKSSALALPFILLITARDRTHAAVKSLLGMVALAVSASRVVLGAHYVSDVIAGIGLSLICFPAVNFLTQKILEKMNPQRLQVAIRVWTLVLFVLLIYLILK